MRTIWKGAISFGLVHVPVKLYPATEKKDVAFNHLHRKCGSPVKYRKYCPVCDEEVEQDDIVRGYEYEDGRYVILTDDDMEAIPIETARTISIVDFVDLAQVDPVYYEKSYYLAPGDGGQKAFELLRQAMEKTGKAAISKVVIRTKESLAVIRPHSRAIMMETMYYPDEIRSVEGLAELNYKTDIHDNEMKMAVNLVESLSSVFDPGKYEDDYRKALFELIHSKAAGERIETPKRREAANVIDLMEALKQSIKIAEEGKRPVAAAGVGNDNVNGEGGDTAEAGRRKDTDKNPRSMADRTRKKSAARAK